MHVELQEDPAQTSTVLLGHSMGGAVAGWLAASKVPLPPTSPPCLDNGIPVIQPAVSLSISSPDPHGAAQQSPKTHSRPLRFRSAEASSLLVLWQYSRMS